MFQSSLDEVLHEVDELDQEPGEDEIREYAELIGIDLDKEPDLLWIARAGITAPLPPDWKPIQVNNGDELYFYNFKTGESSWEHPSDDKYRKLIIEERNKKSEKPKGGVNGEQKTTGKLTAPVLPESLSAQSSLKPLKQPPALGVVGKLAPIGSQQAAAAHAPPTKLQPIGTGTGQSATSKVGAKTLAPIQQNSGVQDRPKTSRGPTDKEKTEVQQQEPPRPKQLGGGSRFLKKNDDGKTESARTTGVQGTGIVQNVLQFPSDESDSLSSSSEEMASDTSAMRKGTTQVPKRMEENKSGQSTNSTAMPAPLADKPPVAPKTTTPVQAAVSKVSSQTAAVQPVEKKNSQSHATTIPTKPSEDTAKVQRQLQEEYERSVKQLREQHDAKLKDVKLKFEEEEKKEMEKMKRTMDERLRSQKEKLHKDEETEIKSLTSLHEKRIQETRLKLEQERAELEKDLRSKRHDDQKEGAQSKETKAALEGEQERALMKLKTRFEKELGEEEKRREDEKRRRKEEMRADLQKELGEWCRQEKERRMAVMKVQVEKEVSSAKSKLEEEQKNEMMKEVANGYERRRRELEQEWEDKLADIKKEHDAELRRVQQRDKDHLDQEDSRHRRRAEFVSNEDFEDLRSRQEDALKTAEVQLKTFREELAALTRMAADIRETFRAPAGHAGSAMITGEGSQLRPEKAKVVKSIENLISPGDTGETSSEASSLTKEKLRALASDDVIDKVTRFLDSQRSASGHPDRRSSRHRRPHPTSPTAATHPVWASVSQTINGAIQSVRDPLTAPIQRRQNIFRLRSKDGIDEFLNRKVNDYFRDSTFDSNLRPSSHHWLPSTSFNRYDRHFGSQGGYDIETELNSLKRWLDQFEHRLISSKTQAISYAPTVLAVGSSSGNQPNQTSQLDEETVNV